MSVEAISGKGVNRARAICDECGRAEVVACDYEPRRAHDWAPNEGQVVKKVTAHGWALVKGKLRCPGCEAVRKATLNAGQERIMTSTTSADAEPKVTPIRQPDRDQKRIIVMALEEAYDTKALRYRGKATDRSVAEDLGGGIMPGWVAALREEFFGPAGNEEIEAIRAEIGKARVETRRLIEVFAAEQAKKLDALEARLGECIAAHDKRVRA